MNNTIWKYPLEVKDSNQLELPKGAKILCVQLQGHAPCLWAEVDKLEIKKQIVTIDIFGTGHEIDQTPRNYLGTFQMHDGYLVFHAYQRL
jgi:hypothetical protein